MNIYLLRHAPAIERGTPGYDKDSSRPLTVEGIKKMKKVAKGLKKIELTFDLILSSPYLRAKQTADILSQEYLLKKKYFFSNHLTPGGSQQELISDILHQYRDHEDIVLVGHEPYLSSLMFFLLSGREHSDFSFELKKAGICKLSIEKLKVGACASLKWILTPGLIQRSA